jgi:predicted RNase H-like HicB family nuclease
MKDYHINIFYSHEDEGYIADVPDLRSCSAFGATSAEALAELKKAKEAWLEAARDAGKRIPKPRYSPAIYQTPRG